MNEPKKEDNGHGGKRSGSGRKPSKLVRRAIIHSLTPLQWEVLEKEVELHNQENLKKGIKKKVTLTTITNQVVSNKADELIKKKNM